MAKPPTYSNLDRGLFVLFMVLAFVGCGVLATYVWNRDMVALIVGLAVMLMAAITLRILAGRLERQPGD